MRSKPAYNTEDVVYIADKYAVFLSQYRIAEEYIGRKNQPIDKGVARNFIGSAQVFASFIPKNCRDRLVGNSLKDLTVKLRSR